ncbi:MAG: hypothetical protein QOJ02_634 [Acidobacteriota bacterium]|jgi:hypothetical protein|nr:hypothetical protein [Acidobacteriota bacterium]
MKAGIIATAFVAVPLKLAKSALAQTSSDNQLNAASSFNSTAGSQLDQLYYYNKSAFAPYVGTEFSVTVKPSKVRAITLIEVRDFVDSSTQGISSGEECFSLLFLNPPGKTFSQKTYEVEHPALGKFSLFLVPVGRFISNGQNTHEAVFNRVTSYNAGYNSAGVVTASATLASRRETYQPPVVKKPVGETFNPPVVNTKPVEETYEQPVVSRTVEEEEEPVISKPGPASRQEQIEERDIPHFTPPPPVEERKIKLGRGPQAQPTEENQ